MKSTISTFSEGLTLDFNEILAPKNTLIDALNATLLTGNGNEFILQNDMGNTMIEDARTGHLMALRDGFIPIGMKEHGGILYIASYNPETGMSQLGSIPSPNITYIIELPTNTTIDILTFIQERNEDNINASITDLINSKGIRLYNKLLNVGDKFLIILHVPQAYDYNEKGVGINILKEGKEYPLISHFDADGNYIKGYYKLTLFVEQSNGFSWELSSTVSTNQKYYLNNILEVLSSSNWFINTPINTSLDIDVNRSDYFRVFPNINQGYLVLKLLPELPSNFSLYSDVGQNPIAFYNLPKS